MFIRSVKSNMREDKNDAYSEEQPMDSGVLQYWSTGYQTWHVSTDWEVIGEGEQGNFV